MIIDAASVQYRGLFQTAMLTRVRLGELLVFQWKHVDFDQQKLEIKQALWEGQIQIPKTVGSTRTIYLVPRCCQASLSKSKTCPSPRRSSSSSASRTATR